MPIIVADQLDRQSSEGSRRCKRTIAQLFAGQWRRSADWIDRMGWVLGALWVVIGLVWTVHEYVDFV